MMPNGVGINSRMAAQVAAAKGTMGMEIGRVRIAGGGQDHGEYSHLHLRPHESAGEGVFVERKGSLEREGMEDHGGGCRCSQTGFTIAMLSCGGGKRNMNENKTVLI